MKHIIPLLCALLLVGCSNMNAPNKTTIAPLKSFYAPKSSAIAPNKIKARITYYNPHEDKWGSRVAAPQIKRAKEGVTVAAHPLFKFNTEIFIPQLKGVIDDGKFVVQDRGGAVTSMKASHKLAFVFDVYLNRSRRATNIFANKMPLYMDVIFLKKG